jgi:hypothetical protein
VNWVNNETVSLKLYVASIISEAGRPLLEKFVLEWRRPLQKIVTPGNFFRYNSAAKHLMSRLDELISKHDISFLAEERNELKVASETAIYTIAVAGPMRAGKSTLINCLLGRNVSPVGDFPTTALPLTIYPGIQDLAIITLKNGKEVKGPADFAFLQQYITQKENRNNRQGVVKVTVTIKSSVLERGLAIRKKISATSQELPWSMQMQSCMLLMHIPC